MKLERLTYTVPEFSALLGIGRATGYHEALSGTIAGVPVITVGRRLLVPRSLADRVLRGESVDANAVTPSE